MFLCTYSVLFLNIREHKTQLAAILHKAKWVLFTIFFPEVTTLISAEQWRSARQSIVQFTRLKQQLGKEQEKPKPDGVPVCVSFITDNGDLILYEHGNLPIFC